jgi:hypothetical protein
MLKKFEVEGLKGHLYGPDAEIFNELIETVNEMEKIIKTIDLECNNENHDSYQMEHAIRDIVFDFLSKYEGGGLR